MPIIYETSHEYQKNHYYCDIKALFLVILHVHQFDFAKLPNLYSLCPQLHVILPSWFQAHSLSPFCKIHIIFIKFLFHFAKFPNEHHCVINAMSLITKLIKQRCSPSPLCQVHITFTFLPSWLQACSPSPFCQVHIIFTKILIPFR
jgi:hypothetical protein